jgi:biotin transporter BioY
MTTSEWKEHFLACLLNTDCEFIVGTVMLLLIGILWLTVFLNVKRNRDE